MFGVSRERLAEGLRRLQQKACAYNRPPCDCKYGATQHEENGCPELRSVAMLLGAMTDAEYAALAKRAGVLLERGTPREE